MALTLQTPGQSPSNRVRFYGCSSSLDSALRHGFSDSICRRHSARLLADIFALARKISDRSGGRVAAGAATHRTWFLSLDRDGLERAVGPILASRIRPRIGVHVHEPGHRVGAVQLAFCGATTRGIL